MARNKKTFITAAVVFMLLIMAVAATFAWQQTVHKVNEFIGKKKDGIILHDDFCGNIKDVYVENTGGGEVFIRIKLNETMKLNSNAPVFNWVAHTYEISATDCGHVNNTTDNELFHKYFTWKMGGWKWYMPGSTDSSGTLSQDTKDYTGVPGAKQTPFAQIIKWNVYAKMNLADQSTFIGWIYDDDGYAYWSQPLKPDTATGLLLNGVSPNPLLNNKEYYYAIDVIVEAVDLKDIPMWTQGAASVDGSGKTYPEATHKMIVTTIAGFATKFATPTSLDISLGSIEFDDIFNNVEENGESADVDPPVDNGESVNNGEPVENGEPSDET